MRPISEFFDQRIIDELTRQVRNIANDAKKNAKSDKIKDAISFTHAEKVGDGKFSATVIVDLEKAPHARAVEYGSGIHATKGDAKKYIIAPRVDGGKQALAFIWPGHTPNFPTGRKYIGEGEGGKLLFRFVEHPGIKADPYLKPAFEANMKSVRSGLARTISRGIRDSIVDVWFRVKT